MLTCIQNLVRFCQSVLEILSGNEILTSIKGRNSVKILRKMMADNPKLDLVNVDVHTKFGQILSIGSQDIERKQNSDVNQGPWLRQNFAKNDGQQSQARSCWWCAYKIWSDSINLFSRYWVETEFWHQSRAVTPSKFCIKWRATIPS